MSPKNRKYDTDMWFDWAKLGRGNSYKNLGIIGDSENLNDQITIPRQGDVYLPSQGSNHKYTATVNPCATDSSNKFWMKMKLRPFRIDTQEKNHEIFQKTSRLKTAFSTNKCGTNDAIKFSVIEDVVYEKIDNNNIKSAMYYWINGDRSLTELAYGPIAEWNTSSVTDMSKLFHGTSSINFDGDISNWDTSAVTDMSYIFSGTSNFASDVSNWDTSSVTNMSRMFQSTTNFSTDLSSWDTSRVTDMGAMLSSSFNFATDLSSWDKIK